MEKSQLKSLIPFERLASGIYLIRGQKVMLDSHLAELYDVPTKRLNEQVSRNSERFPEDFMFQLTQEEFQYLKSQFATSSSWGGRRTLPFVFTEHGVAMLSSVLRSSRAVEVNIAIIRTFVRMREMMANHKDLARKIEEHDNHIAILYEHLQKLLNPLPSKNEAIGFKHPKKSDE
jgi:hypothetical protein